MYTIIIAFAIAIIIGLVLIRSSIDEEFKATIVEFIICGGIILGLFFPISGFNESVLIQEINLIPFSKIATHTSNTEQDIYVKISNNTVFYQYSKERILRNDEDDSAFDILTESVKGHIEIKEISKCKVPVLIVYEKSGKPSKWTFALFSQKIEYVFYIPTGSKQYLD